MKTFTMLGSYRWLPKKKLVVFHIQGEGYYWHESAELDKPNHKWKKQIILSDMPGVDYTFALCLVDEQWMILLNYYRFVHEEFLRLCGKDVWLPIRVSHGETPGLIELCRVIDFSVANGTTWGGGSGSRPAG